MAKVSNNRVTRRFQNGAQGPVDKCPYCGQDTDMSRKRCFWCNWILKRKVN